jgi:hypothetical protein
MNLTMTPPIPDYRTRPDYVEATNAVAAASKAHEQALGRIDAARAELAAIEADTANVKSRRQLDALERRRDAAERDLAQAAKDLEREDRALKFEQRRKDAVESVAKAEAEKAMRAEFDRALREAAAAVQAAADGPIKRLQDLHAAAVAQFADDHAGLCVGSLDAECALAATWLDRRSADGRVRRPMVAIKQWLAEVAQRRAGE